MPQLAGRSIDISAQLYNILHNFNGDSYSFVPRSSPVLGLRWTIVALTRDGRGQRMPS
jgi:hypothetical protein